MEDSKQDTGNNTIKAVYIEETSRSVYERVKHWQLAHQDLPEPPTFKLKVVGHFQDALSRQIAELVRIYMRGYEVLNSTKESSRCRLPRLRIDKEEWRSGKMKDSGTVKDTFGDSMEKKQMWETAIMDEFEEDLRFEDSAWQLGLPREATRKLIQRERLVKRKL